MSVPQIRGMLGVVSRRGFRRTCPGRDVLGVGMSRFGLLGIRIITVILKWKGGVRLGG